jgi:hypothetical protein
MVPVECECGERKTVTLKNLEHGKSLACMSCRGHYRVDSDLIADDRLRRYWRNRWCSINERCYDPKCSKYHNYGGRGITCFWKTQRSFFEFVKTLPGWDHVQETRATLDRIDNDAGYCPGNIRLVDFRTNQQNKQRSIAIDTPIGRCSGKYLKDRFQLKAHGSSISKWIKDGDSFDRILQRDKYAGVRGRDTGACIRHTECGATSPIPGR